MAEVALKIPKLVCRGMQGNQLTFTRRRHMAHCALWASLQISWIPHGPHFVLCIPDQIFGQKTLHDQIYRRENSVFCPRSNFLWIQTPHTHFYRNLKIPHEEIEETVENCKRIIISLTSMPSDPLKEPSLGRLMVARGADSNQVRRFLKDFSSGQKCLSD